MRLLALLALLTLWTPRAPCFAGTDDTGTAPPGPADQPFTGIPEVDAALRAFPGLPLPALLLEQLGPERITSLDARLELTGPDQAEVRERIEVVALQRTIRHGIYRDLPVWRGHGPLALSVLGAEQDHAPGTWRVRHSPGKIRVVLGDPGQELSPGRHVFILRYRVRGLVACVPGKERLVWEVTGSGWDLSMEQVRAELRLPPGRSLLGWQARFHGIREGQRPDMEVMFQDGRGLALVLQDRLLPGQGLVIEAELSPRPGGPPGPQDRLALWIAWLRANPGQAAGVLALALLLCYYPLAWLAAARPRRAAGGPVRPQSRPPRNLGPAAARLLVFRDFDGTALTAALLDAAVKGHVRIGRDGDGVYVLERDSRDLEPLTPGEAAMVEALFAHGDTLRLDGASRKACARAREALSSRLEKELEGALLRSNRAWLWPGYIITMAAMAAVLSQARYALAALLLGLGAYLMITLAGGMLRRGLFSRGLAEPDFGCAGRVAGLVIWLGMGLAWGGILLYLLAELEPLLGTVGLVGLLGCVLLNEVFSTLLQTTTARGRELLNQIKGLSHYLAALAPLDPEKARTAASLDMRRMDALLPWALALDMGKPWFDALAARFQERGLRWNPPWYTGSGSLDASLLLLAVELDRALYVLGGSRIAGSASGGSDGGGGGGGGGGW